MSNVRFSGMFTIDKAHQQDSKSARLEAQEAAKKRRQELILGGAGISPDLPLSFLEVETKDHFYIETTASLSANPKKVNTSNEISAFDNRLKSLLKARNIPFQYDSSPSAFKAKYKAFFNRLSESLF